ncbi:MAG TPA: RAMP superfamily CRISPR-associated protein [Ktedonobacteraceae bacterium]|jgi:CRISPR/Cas system CMR subunit Cmr4 (Cas7 group RAMP superfamily)|nr:RAMP superfamily CRISPR-associated protein [Ktedonobacteraceae bacterium]
MVEPKTDRIQIDYTLRFATLYHFGTGIRDVLVDRTVVRDSGGYLYVPGSTFKGVLRERCEQLARLYAGSKQKERIESPHDPEAALWWLGEVKPTMPIRIFGSHTYPGRLFFDDARQDANEKAVYEGGDGNYKSLQVQTYTQVRIDRPTHTSVPGALYTSEFGNRDVNFYGKIRGALECLPVDLTAYADVRHIKDQRNAPTYSLLLLLAGLRMIDRLGGNKSTGKGMCTCEITSVTINNETIEAQQWESWLAHLEVLAKYNTEESQ